MTRPHFDWHRQAAERFLMRNEGQTILFKQEDVVATALSGKRAVVLLGTPGIGKSTVMHELKPLELAQRRRVVHVNLKGLADWSAVKEEIFRHPALQTFSEQSDPITLMLDSLDECQMRATTLASGLSRELEKLVTFSKARQKLHLILACRSVVWAEAFTPLKEMILEKYGSLSEAELLPLSHEDVLNAAQRSSVDVATFMTEVQQAGADALVTQPLPLIMLLGQFQAGNLPLTRSLSELQERSALRSCEEWDRDRLPHSELLEPIQRLEVASRIAAFLLLCQRRGVTLKLDNGNVPPYLLRVSELVGGQETVHGITFDVLERQLRETLRTGLFRGAGDDEVDVWHASVKEYLAARYLRRFSPDRILALLAHPDDPHIRVVPQLREVALWLARLDSRVADLLINREPALALRAGWPISPQRMSALVKGLLENADDLGNEVHIIQNAEQLLEAGLKEQVAKVLIDPDANEEARHNAFLVVRAVSVPAFANDLLTVILNEQDAPVFRERAARFLMSWSNDQGIMLTLQDHLANPDWSDPNDGVRSAFLNRVWPNSLATSDLLHLVKAPTDKTDVYSLYRYFLDQESTWAAISAENIAEVLEWLTSDTVWCWAAEALGSQGLSGVVKVAWTRRNEPQVGEQLTTILAEFIKSDRRGRLRGKSWLTLAIEEDQIVRHWCVERFVSRPAEAWPGHSLPHPGFLNPQDAEWILEKMRADATDTERLHWLEVLRIEEADRNSWEALWDLSEQHPAIKERVAWHFKMPLDHHVTRQLREEYLAAQKDGSSRRRRLQTLLRAEKEAQEHWPRLVSALQHPDHAGEMIQQALWQPEIKTYPGWTELDEEMLGELLTIAQTYVLQAGLEDDEWVESNQITRSYLYSLAGYQALHLLSSEQTGWVEALEASVWNKWIPIILRFPNLGTGDETHFRLLRAAYRLCRDRFLDTVERILQAGASKDSLDVPDHWGVVQDIIFRERLERIMLDLPPGHARRSLMARLVSWGHAPTLKLACDALEHLGTQEEAEQARVAAWALFWKDPQQYWPHIWQFMQTSPEVARETFETIAVREAPVERLGAAEVLQLYDWLLQHFPKKDDPVIPSGGYMVTERIAVAQFRDRLPEKVLVRGSLEAVQALRDWTIQHPSLAWVYQAALEYFRRNTWPGLKTDEFLQLVVEPRKRLIRSSGDLLDAVVESLNQLNDLMQGETPLAPLLWSEVFSPTRKPEDVIWQPRSEERLSDLLRWHLELSLRGMGLILHREVEIRSPQGQAKGQRTDLMVETEVISQLGDATRIGVIIEVKGQWNSDLKKALDDQLVSAYLRDNPNRAGLYVVGFFRCNQWDEQDNRKQIHKQLTVSLHHLTQHLDAQAAALSKPAQPIQAFVLNASLRSEL